MTNNHSKPAPETPSWPPMPSPAAKELVDALNEFDTTIANAQDRLRQRCQVIVLGGAGEDSDV